MEFIFTYLLGLLRPFSSSDNKTKYTENQSIVVQSQLEMSSAQLSSGPGCTKHIIK